MTVLAIYSESGERLEQSSDPDAIREQLAAIGVRYERWPLHPLADDADQAAVLAAYADEVAALNTRYGFSSVDVVALAPDDPAAPELRRKFLAEHVHDDYEIRYFVDGRGLFYLHAGGQVNLVLCGAGDLLSVPAGTPHWFDMGARPCFKCIRFFTTPNGWEARFTGDEIAARFPDFDAFVEAVA